ncbi:MAG: TrkH family potassium uptake protein [Rhodospirillales bacterium]
MTASVRTTPLGRSSRTAKPRDYKELFGLDLGSIAFFIAAIICFFGLSMLLPASLDYLDGNNDAYVFLACAAILVFLGLTMALTFRRRRYALGLREVILAAPLSWITVVGLSALPFVFSGFHLSYTDAVFETMSGATATGSTVIVGLDGAPRGLLFWRFLLLWFGGFGFVTLAVLVLPFLRIGGMQLFVLDLSAQSDKFVPRMIDVVIKIALVYLAITVGGMIAFHIAGMTLFDAACHSMAAVATAGFSTHDAGLGFFKSPAIEWIATVEMALSAMPFVLFLGVFRQGLAPLWNDAQARLFLGIIVVSSLTLTVWLILREDIELLEALRQATFNVVSIISTTGFASQDYNLWGGFASVLFLMLMIVGGCTGSTAGGVKMFRLCLLLEAIRAQLHRQIYPHGTFLVTYNNRPVQDTVRAGVTSYFFVYLSTFFMFSLALSLTGMSFETSLGASATALGGVGPGLGDVVGPCCTFAPLSDAAKWMLSLEMLAGRLEILVVVIPFTRTFWRT